MSSGEAESPVFDTSVAHIARVYDYWLGGKDDYPVDRVVGERVMQAYPDIVYSVRANRAFLDREVRYLVGEVGIRQFLDVGTGIPTANNTHEVAQSVAAECRVVYVDNDPIVLAHARALLTSDPAGATDYIEADLRETGQTLARAAQSLDFSEPVAVMLLGILHMIPDHDDPYAIAAGLMDAVPAGSFLAIPIRLPTSTPRKGPRRPGATTPRPPSRPRSGHVPRSRRCSRGWTWWSPAWCAYRNGGLARRSRPRARRTCGAG